MLISVQELQRLNENRTFTSDMLDTPFESANFDMFYKMDGCNLEYFIRERFCEVRSCNNFWLRLINFYCVHNLLYLRNFEEYDVVEICELNLFCEIKNSKS